MTVGLGHDVHECQRMSSLHNSDVGSFIVKNPAKNVRWIVGHSQFYATLWDVRRNNIVALRKYFRLQSLPGDGIPPNNRRVDRLMMPTSSWVREVVGRL
ncbi:hypothetical protein AWB81_04720 [Caballeronia arationis]|nr:hypothetical protein AWB81_04720 [Caballeronia arationis]